VVIAVSAGNAIAAPWLIAALATIIAFVISGLYRSALLGRWTARLMSLPLLVLACACAARITSFPGLMASLGATLLVFAFLLVRSRWKDTKEELETFRAFSAAREFFRQQLDQKKPIDERWIPYVLAFDLGSNLDEWFVAVPQSGTGHVHTSSHFLDSSTFAGSSEAPLLASGGGAFGGAGATGGWASTINSFAAPVPPPSSGLMNVAAGLIEIGVSAATSSKSGGGSGGGW
jgi:hypothetical protein